MPFLRFFFLNKHFIHISFISSKSINLIPLLLQIALLRMEDKCGMTVYSHFAKLLSLKNKPSSELWLYLISLSISITMALKK